MRFRLLLRSRAVAFRDAMGAERECTGRRVLDSYLLMFLTTIPEFDAGVDVDREHILETHALGEFVAPHWGLGRVMRWSPVETTEESTSVGLYKVQVWKMGLPGRI